MAQDFALTPTTHLDLATLGHLLSTNARVVLSEEASQRIEDCHRYLHNRLEATPDAPIYGINTGFGALCNTAIAPEQRQQLQVNLMMSHACGTGEEVPAELVRLMLLLKAQSLSYGHSGVQLSTVQRLLDFYNREMLPIVYQQGSLGASGDLAPLAHLCLPLLGLGEVNYMGYRLSAADAQSLFSWQPLTLKAKEGLALLNGTQFMLAYGVHTLLRARRLAAAADVIGALSLEAFGGRSEPFDERLHRIRPHAGQLTVAQRVRELLVSSELQLQPRLAVQDPYSFRCMPQVHGASRDALAYVQQVVETECNAVTDNPNIFPDDDAILSGGNFHGQPLALALDMLAMAVAELGSISERRTYQLISGQRGLPPFLVAEPGLNSGLMIPQYTAAGIVSQNKQLCTPSSVDSIVSSNGQEDHVSMGANAATKARRVVENVEQVLGIELFTATQALAFRHPGRTSAALEEVVAAFREKVPFVSQDRILYPDLHAAAAFVRAYAWQ
ncbi:histidine ammonia-lyase [Hymenobacter taeanensis]|uniref:Histidine ammonia-lyase n=1 Tax=Hymenobacter taeanensis TaxID=2735321 RepID=A0A6M6BMD3_9BACT|nr:MULTISPECIES: histidine ammonia-lyase [Hymenobacter]QJX48275.1 histidine ammonia-lyase [Hymenobacter taeanensis]UOQ82242.1 histidine ammonia-lyase [Hymenobacter sp. 5414T-23]